MKEEHELLRFFKYAHLPKGLQLISQPFHDLAKWVDETLKDGAEKTAALRKLLEAKDCAVRSAI